MGRPVAPRVLVLGGTGTVGTSVVEACAERGWPVTALARKTPDADVRCGLFARAGVEFERLDTWSSIDSTRLRALMSGHDLVIVACEPIAGEAAATIGVTRVYEIAAELDFTVEANDARTSRHARKRLVRIASAAAELPHRLVDDRPGFAEDAVTLESVVELCQTDPTRDFDYFRTKLQLAGVARRAIDSGIDVVTAMPTYVVSQWGAPGSGDPLVQAYHTARSFGFLPAAPVNVVPSELAGRAILDVARFGHTGQAYQIEGIETDTCELHAIALRQLGLKPRGLQVSRAQLLDALHALSGRARSNAWMDAWRLSWDAALALALRSFAVEAWHLALMLEGANRSSDKLLALLDAHGGDEPPPCALRASEIEECVRMAARSRAARLRRMGHLL